MSITPTQPLLALQRIAKHFGGIHALEDVDLELYPNEVLAVVGDNGAGKSTLIKIIAGALQPDHGEILLDGHRVELSSPRAARELGIETVFQELALVNNLDVVENIFLGRTLTRFRWFIDKRKMRAEAAAILTRLNISIPSLNETVENLSGGQRQALALGRAITWGGRIVLLDEPTAALGVKESHQVLQLIKQLKEHQVSIIVISHNMRDVFAIADRILVLRGGRKVATLVKSETTVNDVVKWITGYDDTMTLALS